MITIELTARDLTAQAIQRFKDAGCWNENWDVFPLAILEFDPAEQDDEENDQRGGAHVHCDL